MRAQQIVPAMIKVPVELDRVLDVGSIDTAEYIEFWNSGRDARCVYINVTSFTSTQDVLPVFDDKLISVDDALTAVKGINWQRPSLPVPFFAVTRQGLLVKKLTLGLRGNSKWDVEEAFAVGVNLTYNVTHHKCSQLEVIKAATKLFEAYPVMLLMWGGDPNKTPITYSCMVKRRPEIEAALNKDATVKQFFQGKTHVNFVSFAYFMCL